LSAQSEHGGFLPVNRTACEIRSGGSSQGGSV
jgi:hypothetical protein